MTTIYAETLVEPAFAETVAKSTGAHLATLDPIEGLTSTSAGHDYVEVMRSNLATLEAGQGCSRPPRPPSRPTRSSRCAGRPSGMRTTPWSGTSPSMSTPVSRGDPRPERRRQVDDRQGAPRVERPAGRGAAVRHAARPVRPIETTRLGYVPQRHTLSGSVRATAERSSPPAAWCGSPGSGGRRRPTVRSSPAFSTSSAWPTGRIDVSTLSGGQQRRVLIARALAAQPDVLLMDEPTAGVDTASQHVLAEVLGRLAAQGVTCWSSPTRWTRSSRS